MILVGEGKLRSDRPLPRGIQPVSMKYKPSSFVLFQVNNGAFSLYVYIPFINTMYLRSKVWACDSSLLFLISTLDMGRCRVAKRKTQGIRERLVFTYN